MEELNEYMHGEEGEETKSSCFALYGDNVANLQSSYLCMYIFTAQCPTESLLALGSTYYVRMRLQATYCEFYIFAYIKLASAATDTTDTHVLVVMRVIYKLLDE